MSRRNIKLTLSYDGTDFFGWQTQPNRRTVQETLETALAALTGEERVRVNASGRTDTGVHALGQVVNFHTETKYPADVLLRAVNARLPEDVVIAQSEEVVESFDANRDARRKLYRYVLHDGDVPNLFLRRYCHHTRSAGTTSAASRRSGPTGRRVCAPSRTCRSTASARGSGWMWRLTASCTIWCEPSRAR